MRAHVIVDGRVTNTIEVEDLGVMPGLVDASAGGNIGDFYDENAGIFTAPPIDPLESRSAAKVARQAAVDAIQVAVSSGKVFDGDEVSQTRMSRAIVGMQAAGASSITWTLADNTQTAVTVEELTEALILAGQEQSRLWEIGQWLAAF